MKAKYIKTMDFIFEDVEILNADTEEKLLHKIKESEILKIKNGTEIEYINPDYIMFFGLEEK
ncbi:MAG: hypothetical protein IJ223_06715 [Clostridia bacterium]|nr:hypothetical protein [Clostridia bacterium]